VKAGGLDENQINSLDKIAKNEVKLIKCGCPGYRIGPVLNLIDDPAWRTE
jgi:hypothetical protein